MARKTINAVPSDEDLSNKSSIEKKRPGTSGTELLLKTNRRAASDRYLAAQRAETAYKAKKRSAGARQHRADAKLHFSRSFAHLSAGCKSTGYMFMAVPWMFRDWHENRQIRNEKAAIDKYERKKKKLEELVARQEAEKQKKGEKEGDDEEMMSGAN